MDALIEKYDDLNNLVDNLKMAENECKDIDYQEEILELMRRVQIDIENIEPQIEKHNKAEQRELENEFERSRF